MNLVACTLALLALVSQAQGVALPCDPNKGPHGVGSGKIAVIGNTFNPSVGMTDVVIQWDNPTANNPAYGCFTEWVVERNLDGKRQAQVVVPIAALAAGPRTTPVRANMRVVPGKAYTYTVFSRNKDGKTSLRIASAPVMSASQPQGRPQPK